MELDDKVTQLEDEIKILKNEIQAVLLDLREIYLDKENPFSQSAVGTPVAPIIINQPPPLAPEFSPAPSLKAAIEDALPVIGAPEPVVEAKMAVDMPASADKAHASDNEPLGHSNGKPRDKVEEFLRSERASSKRGDNIPEADLNDNKRTWRGNAGVPPATDSGSSVATPVVKIDIDGLSRLSDWVDDTVKQIGVRRAQTIIDVVQTMGHITPELGKILVKFIKAAPLESSTDVKSKDYLSAIMALAGLLGKDNKSEIILMCILCQENEDR